MGLKDKKRGKNPPRTTKSGNVLRGRGGYSSYIWHEAAFDKDIEYISFSRALKEWNWKIGTGIYVGKINEEIENRRKAFAKKRFNDLWISIAFVLLLFQSHR